jgi:hypothetical protein
MRFTPANSLQISMALCVVALMAACATTADQLPDFSFTKQETFAARADFRRSDHEVLFLLMMDASGRVVKARVIDWKRNTLSRETVERVKRIGYQIEFPAAGANAPRYRELIYPMNVDTSVEIQ